MVRGFRKSPSHIPHRTTMSWKAATMASCHQHKSNKTRVNSAPPENMPSNWERVFMLQKYETPSPSTRILQESLTEPHPLSLQ